MAWRIDWCRSWGEAWAPDAQRRWRRILAEAEESHVYHRPEIVRAWAETRGAEVGARPAVGFAEDGEGAGVLLPWVVVPHDGRLLRRRVLEPAGQALFGYHDPLVAGRAEGRDWPALWEAARRALADEHDQAQFRFVREACGQGPLSARCSDASPVLALAGAGDLEAVLRRCSANHRGDVRRRLRRLAEKGEPTLWVATAGQAGRALEDLRGAFLPAWRASGAQRGGDALEAPGAVEFVARVVAEGVAQAWAHYAVLRVGGTPVAWHLGLAHGSDLYWWLPTHDAGWAAWSPGKVLLAMLVEHAAGRGIARLHFLTGGQPYKLAWRPDRPPLRTMRWHAPTARGWMLARYDGRRRAPRSVPDASRP